jgi:hypothetical protein
MKVYVVVGDEHSILAIFRSREDAESSFPDDSIEEHEVCESVLPPWTYWHRGAAVYPDGKYQEWTREETARGYVSIPPCDDHLNRLPEPWDGHTQGHCGEHISIFGTDRTLVEAAFQEHLAKAIARQNGICQSIFPHHRPADGRTMPISRGNTWAALRDQSQEMAKDFIMRSSGQVFGFRSRFHFLVN